MQIYAKLYQTSLSEITITLNLHLLKGTYDLMNTQQSIVISIYTRGDKYRRADRGKPGAKP